LKLGLVPTEQRRSDEASRGRSPIGLALTLAVFRRTSFLAAATVPVVVTLAGFQLAGVGGSPSIRFAAYFAAGVLAWFGQAWGSPARLS
jgi:hypothetical protein